MSEAEIHTWATWLEILLAGVTCLALLFITAPYGRHRRSGWGATVPNRVGWILMEMPAVVLFVWIFALGEHRVEAVPLAFLGLWQLHYIHRVSSSPFACAQQESAWPCPSRAWPSHSTASTPM